MSEVVKKALSLKLHLSKIWIAVPEYFFCLSFSDKVKRSYNNVNEEPVELEREERINNAQNFDEKNTKTRYSISRIKEMNFENLKIYFFSEISITIEERYKDHMFEDVVLYLNPYRLEYKKRKLNILCLLSSCEIIWYDIIEPHMSNREFDKRMLSLPPARERIYGEKTIIFISDKKESHISYQPMFNGRGISFIETLPEHSAFNPVNVLFKMMREKVESSRYDSGKELDQAMSSFFKKLKTTKCRELVSDEVVKFWRTTYADKLRKKLRV